MRMLSDGAIISKVREAVRRHTMEPSDLIGRRKLADTIREMGVKLIDGDDGVAISRTNSTVICLADGRKLLSYHTMEMVLRVEWTDVEIIPTPEEDDDAR